jgi:hypothetical protein
MDIEIKRGLSARTVMWIIQVKGMQKLANINSSGLVCNV